MSPEIMVTFTAIRECNFCKFRCIFALHFSRNEWPFKSRTNTQNSKPMKDATLVLLPETGIKGNSHFLMQELNNDVIAKLVADWTSSKISN